MESIVLPTGMEERDTTRLSCAKQMRSPIACVTFHTSLMLSEKLLPKICSSEQSSYSLHPHRNELLHLCSRLSRQLQDALPVLMAGVGRIGEVLHTLQDDFQCGRKVLPGLKVKILPKSFNIQLRAKGTENPSKYPQNGLQVLTESRRCTGKSSLCNGEQGRGAVRQNDTMLISALLIMGV